MAGPWQRAHEKALRSPNFLDLTDSRFHQNGLLPDRALFERAFGRWLDSRRYEPDSRGAPPARRALREFYATQGWPLGEDQFFLTAGTSEAYALLFSTFAAAGDVVALPRPGYPLFEQLAVHSRLETVFYDQPESLGWQPAAGWEACLTDRTRFVVLISPNNPTGQVISKEALAAVAEVCVRRDVILIVDEVFDACWEGPHPLPRAGALFPELKAFTLNGISKRFGSPDLKLAWIAVSGPEDWVTRSCETLELANDTFLSANSFSQFLLPDLFKGMTEWQTSLRNLLRRNKNTLALWLTQNPEVSGRLPDGGIHGLLRFEGLPDRFDDEAWAVELMETESLALHPGFFYDVQEPGVWLVYSLLKEHAAFEDGLRRLSRRLAISSRSRGPDGLR